MPIELQVAWVSAIATVFAALIATAGAALIFTHRKLVIELAKQVEAYHAQEGLLIKELIRCNAEQPTESLVKHRQGVYRQEGNAGARPSMTAQEARRIRRRYLNAD